jgi:hypothetical protein
MSAQKGDNREDGRCKFCGSRLSLVKRMRKEEFCSPEHRDDFLLLNGDVAMQRLTQGAEPKEAWKPRARGEQPEPAAPAAPVAPAPAPPPAPARAKAASKPQAIALPLPKAESKPDRKKSGPAAGDPALARLLESAAPPQPRPSLLDAARGKAAVEAPAPAPPPDPPQARLSAPVSPSAVDAPAETSRMRMAETAPEPAVPGPVPAPASLTVAEDEEIEVIVEARKTLQRPPGGFLLNGWCATGPLSPRPEETGAEELLALSALAYPCVDPEAADFAGLKMNGEMAGLVDQAHPVAGDLMTILAVRAKPIAFGARAAVPPAPSAEPEDWEAFARYAERRAKEEAGPAEAGFVEFTGVPARGMAAEPVSALFGGDRMWPDWRAFLIRPRMLLARRPAGEGVEPPLGRPTTVLMVSAAAESARRRIFSALTPAEVATAPAVPRTAIPQSAPPQPSPVQPLPVSFRNTFDARPRESFTQPAAPSAVPAAGVPSPGKRSAQPPPGDAHSPSALHQPPAAGPVPLSPAGRSFGFGFSPRTDSPRGPAAPAGPAPVRTAPPPPAGQPAFGPAGPIVALALHRIPPAAPPVDFEFELADTRRVISRVYPEPAAAEAPAARFDATPGLNGARALSGPLAHRQPNRAEPVPHPLYPADRAAVPAPAPAIFWESPAGAPLSAAARALPPPAAALLLQCPVGLQAMISDCLATLPPRGSSPSGFEFPPARPPAASSTPLRPRPARAPYTAIALRLAGEDRPAEPSLTPHSVEFAATADQWSVLA